MPRFDLNVHSRAIEIIRPGSRHRFHKTSCKVIKLSQLYKIDVKNTFPIDWHCNDKQRIRQPRVTKQALNATPSIYLPANSI